MPKLGIPITPKHPERLCWGCEKLCPANDLRCGNGTIRTQHPAELFGDDWMDWGSEHPANVNDSFDAEVQAEKPVEVVTKVIAANGVLFYAWVSE
jgi:hypothetical protein